MPDKLFQYHGQCLCGEVKYEIAKFQPRMGNCHCRMCRKFHGAAFSSFGEVRRQDFRWIKGESTLASYTAENGSVRQFCKHCGSSLSFSASSADGSLVEIALGTLDTPISFQPDAHIYVADKANWHTICDELPQYEAGRGGKPLE